MAGRQRTRDSSSGLVGRLLCGGAAESAGVSPQAAADVDRIRLRVFSSVSAGRDGGFLPADDGQAACSRAVHDDFRPGLPGRRHLHAGAVQRIRPSGRERVVQPSVLLRGVGLPVRRLLPQKGASGEGRQGPPGLEMGGPRRSGGNAAAPVPVGTPGGIRPGGCACRGFPGSPGLENERRGRREGILQQVLPHGAGRRFAGQAVPLAHAREGDVHRVHAVRRRLP